MEAKWIRKTGNPELILFFCGWSFDEHCVAHLCSEGFDVVVVYDYRNLSLQLSGLEHYRKLTVVAWSFGVWVAANLQADGVLKADEFYAVNGSLNPVSDSHGIPEAIFDGTLRGLTEETMAKFNMRICGGARQHARMQGMMPLRDFSEQSEELELLGVYFREGRRFDLSVWSAAVVASNDLIFPAANLLAFWGDKAVKIAGAHLCFGDMETWHQLLELLKKKANE